MKSLIFFLTFLYLSIALTAQKYSVTAQSGLILRSEPSKSAKKIGLLPFGTELEILDTYKSEVIRDGNKAVSGKWVKVSFQNFPAFISNEKFGYVFDVFLCEKQKLIDSLSQKIAKFPALKDYKPAGTYAPFYIQGDFFGDKIEDIAMLVRKDSEEVRLCLINNAKNTNVHLLGGENDPFRVENYNWVGVFQTVKAGTVLWSNFEEDWREYEDVPKSEKVRLNYDAIFVHASESCGGGLIFWKNGKLHWLQQE